MILDENPQPAPGRPWSPWRDGIVHALLVGAATAVGTKLGEWGVEVLKARARKTEKTPESRPTRRTR